VRRRISSRQRSEHRESVLRVCEEHSRSKWKPLQHRAWIREHTFLQILIYIRIHSAFPIAEIASILLHFTIPVSRYASESPMIVDDQSCKVPHWHSLVRSSSCFLVLPFTRFLRLSAREAKTSNEANWRNIRRALRVHGHNKRLFMTERFAGRKL